MIRYHYSLINAEQAGEHEHPQVVISKTFPDAIDFEPAPIGDCWFFRAEQRDDLPRYILPCGDDGVPIWGWHSRAAMKTLAEWIEFCASHKGDVTT